MTSGYVYVQKNCRSENNQYKVPLTTIKMKNSNPVHLSLCTLAWKEIKKFKEQRKLLSGESEGQL